MLKELIIGFDCREMWMPEAEVKSWENKSQLLNPDVTRILGIHRAGWRSVFLPREGKYSLAAERETAPGYELALPDEWTTSYRYWSDLEAMEAFITEHPSEYQKKCWTIAMTIVQTPKYIEAVKIGEIKILPIEDREPDSQWKCLGYDVEDGIFCTDGLSRIWIEEYEIPRKALWGHRLNEYYLFSKQDDAVEYAEYHFKLSPGAGTQVVFGLYLIQEIP